MAQAEFKIVAPTYRYTYKFDRDTGQRRKVGTFLVPGTEKLPDGREVPLKYVCDESDAEQNASSRALEPLNDVARAAAKRVKAHQELHEEPFSLEPEPSEVDELRARIAQLEALVKPPVAAAPKPGKAT